MERAKLKARRDTFRLQAGSLSADQHERSPIVPNLHIKLEDGHYLTVHNRRRFLGLYTNYLFVFHGTI
jgi:hypothetical protein